MEDLVPNGSTVHVSCSAFVKNEVFIFGGIGELSTQVRYYPMYEVHTMSRILHKLLI